MPTAPEFEQIPVPIYAGVAAIALGAVGMGGWYWSLSREAAQLQERTTQLEQEAQRLKVVLDQITQFQTRKKSLEERISVIENLKENQRGPVDLMNEVIAAIPDNPPGLWLTGLTQREANVTIEGRAFDVPFIADFIAALNDSPLFRSVELQFWEQDQPASIRFQLNCEAAATQHQH